MHSLHIIDNLKLGGTQNLASRTWDGLRDRGHDVTLCVLVNSANEAEWASLPDDVIRLNCHGDYRRPGAISRWGGQLAEVVRQHEPDILHSWLWLSDVVTASAATRSGIPHVVHVVDRRTWQESSRWRHRYRRWMTQRLFRNAGSRFLAVSQAAADYAVQVLDLPAERMDVAYNSINPDPFLDIPDSSTWHDPAGALHLGIAARIEVEKGHIHLLEAIRTLRDRNEEVRLSITGDGSQKHVLEEFVKQHELRSAVQFVGWVDSVVDFLSGIDVFMVPSVSSEGLPTTILEAMAAGRVVVASDIGGAAEAIDDRTDGLIVPPADPAALADAISYLNTHRQTAEAMSVRARKKVAEEFSMTAMMDTIVSQYDELVAAVTA